MGKIFHQGRNRPYLVRKRRHIRSLLMGLDTSSDRYSRLATPVGMSEQAPLLTPTQGSDP